MSASAVNSRYCPPTVWQSFVTLALSLVFVLGSGVVSGLLPEVPYVGPLISAAAQIVLGGIS